jgi:hypothetical protein
VVVTGHSSVSDSGPDYYTAKYAAADGVSGHSKPASDGRFKTGHG